MADKTPNMHHPYFNNHSPSRFQQQRYCSTSPYKKSMAEGDSFRNTNDPQFPSISQSYHHRQAPRTPSKLSQTTPVHYSRGNHATSAMLASLDKSILQIRYFLNTQKIVDLLDCFQ